MVNEPERLPTTNECGRHLLHVAREHLISPMRFCLACLAIAMRLLTQNALNVALLANSAAPS